MKFKKHEFGFYTVMKDLTELTHSYNLYEYQF